MAVQVAQRIAGRPIARKGQVLRFVHELGQLLFQRIIFVVGGAPTGLAQDALRLGIHHDPAAVHHGKLTARLVPQMGDPLHGAFFAGFTGRIQRDLFATGGHPVDLHRLFSHQKGCVAGGKKSVVHVIGAGVIRCRLFHVAEQGAGLEHPAEVAVRVQNGEGLGEVIQFHCQTFLFNQKQAAPREAQPVWGQYILRDFLRSFRQMLKHANAIMARRSSRKITPLPPSS